MTGWWFQTAAIAQCYQQLRPSTTDLGQVSLQGFAMASFPMTFADHAVGEKVSLVSKLCCFDPCHEAHIMEALYDKVTFKLHGLLDGSHERFSLMNVRYQQQYPTPIVALEHDWLLQTIEDPPASILTTTHGEVVILRHRSQSLQSKSARVHTVGAASTISLCGKDSQLKAGDDPWIAQDPWKQYTQGKSASCIPSASDGIQQLADRIQNEVLQKLPAMTQMEQDDMPERLSTLENQVQQLMGQHKALDQNVQDLSNQNAQQFATMQCQLTQQSQQLQGQIDGHCQNMQALMEHQMVQIRGLLSKRPRDESSME